MSHFLERVSQVTLSPVILDSFQPGEQTNKNLQERKQKIVLAVKRVTANFL